MALKQALYGVARCISAFSAHHTFDATEIEVNALDSSGCLRLRRVLVLNSRSYERPETDQLAAILVSRGVVPADNAECRALRGDLVIDRWCFGFFEGGVPSRLERDRGLGTVAMQ